MDPPIRPLAADSDETPASALSALPAAPARRPRPATAPNPVGRSSSTDQVSAGRWPYSGLTSQPSTHRDYQADISMSDGSARPDLFHRASALGIPALVVRPADPGLTGHLPGITIVKPFGYYRRAAGVPGHARNTIILAGGTPAPVTMPAITGLPTGQISTITGSCSLDWPCFFGAGPPTLRSGQAGL